MGKRAENGGLHLAQRCRKLSSANAPKKCTQCETRVQQFKRLRPRGIGAGMISRPQCKVPHFHVMYKIYIRIQRKSTSHPFVVPQPAPLKCVLPRHDTLRQTAELASMDWLPMCTPLRKNCIRQAHLLGEHTVTYHTHTHTHWAGPSNRSVCAVCTSHKIASKQATDTVEAHSCVDNSEIHL